MNEESARAFATEWVRLWNAHDLEAILSHYSDDFEMSSPFIPSVVGGATDTLRGKEAVGKYWRAALDRFPDLAFKLADVLVAQNSLVIYYRSVSDKMAAEVMIFGEDGKVVKAMAHYAD